MPVAPRLRTLAANLALSAASVAFVLVFAEVALRVLEAPPRGGKEQLERDRYMDHDPVLGWRKRPGARVLYDRRDFQTQYAINAHGLRGPDRPYARAPGVPRVLALGDSFVEGFFVPDDATIAARLEQRLSACRAEVVNGGTVGYSTDQEYLFFREEGHRYAPDLVLLFVYHNDIPYLTLDRYGTYAKPRLDFEASPPRVANAPVPAEQAPARAPAAAPPARSSRSRVLAFLKDRLKLGWPRAYDRLAGYGLWAPLTRLKRNAEIDLYRVPPYGHLAPSWTVFTLSVQSLSKEVQAAGGRLAVVYIPASMEVTAQAWEATQIRYGMAPGEFEPNAVARRVGQICQRLKVPYLDLTPAFTAATTPYQPLYFRTDSHWNGRGIGVAAEALDHFVRQQALLPGCPAPQAD